MYQTKKNDLMRKFSAWKVPGEAEFQELIDFASVVPSAGNGLEAESNGRLKVKCTTNSGLVADSEGLAVQCGDGLTTQNGRLSVCYKEGITHENNTSTQVDELKLHAAQGSALVDNGTLHVVTGSGVTIDGDGQLALDCDNRTLVIEKHQDRGYLKVNVDSDGGLIVKDGTLTLNIANFMP
ncbi:hypothetical protein [Mycetohabitans rhizoxinica]|uniref:hypothetical protein n=1 Tax=Mycetohabitans rhizoxinica TaxID=412963 RepID=UPI0030D3C027